MNGKQEREGLHLLYKKLGETPLETINRFKKDNPEFLNLPMTYAGRLDPMAEGLLILLSGESVNEKEEFSDLPKTYEFEILWGFKTDTLDLLGIVGDVISDAPKEDNIKDKLEKSIGKFEQLYPVYSSRPVNGKSLLNWAREGRLSEINIPKHEVELISAKFETRRTISKKELLENLEERINLVNGDFRQAETLDKWKEVLSNSKKEEFVIDKVSIEVSSGFYVRQLVADLAESLGVSGTTYSINRFKIGSYTL